MFEIGLIIVTFHRNILMIIITHDKKRAVDEEDSKIIIKKNIHGISDVGGFSWV